MHNPELVAWFKLAKLLTYCLFRFIIIIVTSNVVGWHRHLKVILSASWVPTFVTTTVMQECTIGLQGLFSGLICPCTYPSLSKVFLLTKSVLSLWGRTLAAAGFQLAPSLCTIKLSCGFPADGRLVLLRVFAWLGQY